MAREASGSDVNKNELVSAEEKTLAFWEDNKIFQKTLEKKSPKGNFVFFDGPPFATGLPHYGHLLPSTIKDVIPRYKTMQGYKVERLWGWDCHGLPVENIIEQKLGLNQKSEIEEYGVEKFNEAARDSVMEYDDAWWKTIRRVGRWVTFENSYKTMDSGYTESVWWAFKELYDKNFIYEGYKSMHICPRCETTLALSEVAQGYKDIVDLSAIAKFEVEGEKGTYLLAWTTTPWTLPGNVALAVGKDISYVKVKTVNKNTEKEEYYILAEEKLSLLEGGYEVVEEMKGEALVGLSYTPPFSYYKGSSELENKENGWKVYSASFVTVSEGTGIVHVAPAFGEDDLALGQEYNLPFVQHVGLDGRFKEEVTEFKKAQVKPKDDHSKADIEIIKYLAHNNLLFKKEKITHSYPHCWRCDTPLLNYAASSWFVSVTNLKEKLLKVSDGISWTPKHIKEGRFGKWLSGARDWAISRSRFWGAPLPVWKCETCEKVEVVGSLKELKEKALPSKNKYTMIRHGEALSNRLGVVNGIVDQKYALTEKGKRQAQAVIKKLKAQKIDMIVSSPLPRTQETAEILKEGLGLTEKDMVFDARLADTSFGEFEGKKIEKYRSFFKVYTERLTKRPQGGESLADVERRVSELLYEIEEKYEDKNILFVGHDDPLWMLSAAVEGLHDEAVYSLRKGKEDFMKNGEFRELSFVPLPHNSKTLRLDLHKPYIDGVTLMCSCGETMKRISEVFDCWFESGSMPYARFHYPFENKKAFSRNFPADFIAEGLDQTRGWFYSMLILSVGLFGKAPFKHAIVNGLILAEDGQKMSKRLKNYPDPEYIFNKYGADALRLYILESPVVRGESLAFSEKGVREIQNKILTRFRNVCAFYELYKGTGDEKKNTPFMRSGNNVLDEWILVRLNELKARVTESLDGYELDKAVRFFLDFVDDLSTWYIRRSRDRFKGEDVKDKEQAIATTGYVLFELSKLLAPFAPFVAEEIHGRIRETIGKRNTRESVHLEPWPKSTTQIPVWPNPMALVHRIFRTNKELNILRAMEDVREIVSLGLEARASAGIKVRQPLSVLKVKKKYTHIKNNEGLITLIKDEINVKDVDFGASCEEDVELDLNITEELKQEGNLRDLIRSIQELRKKGDYNPKEEVRLFVKTDKAGKTLVGGHATEIKKGAVLSEIVYEENLDGEEVEVGDVRFILKI